MFERAYSVRYSDIGIDGKMSINAIVRYLQDISIDHSEEVGLGVGTMAKNNMAWLLYNWHIDIKDTMTYPMNFVIKTDASRYSSLYSIRDFRILSMDGRVLVDAYAIWILVSLNDMRPLKVPKHLLDAYTKNPIYIEKVPKFLIKPPTVFDHKLKVPLCKSKIDTNRHMNNACAVELLMEFVDIDKECSIDILYKKAAYHNDILTVGTSRLSDTEVIAVILNDKNELCVGAKFKVKGT